MTIKIGKQSYLTDNDLQVKVIGFWPRLDIQNKKLKKIFKKNYGRSFLGGDEIVAYSQSLVAKGMDFAGLEQDILNDVENEGIDNFGKLLFSKTATGIGRGHSLGGLSGVNLGMHGTKMIDSGLTGLCSSRSLVSSGRRKVVTLEDIAIPESIGKDEKLLSEFMQISNDVFNVAASFKEKYGKLGGIETFNKILPYNNPGDLEIVLPLDTLATITAEVRADNSNPNGRFLPREIHHLAELIPGIAKQVGQGIMFRQRIEVPRDTYLHYNAFTDPSYPNYALEKGQEVGMSLEPRIIDCKKDFTPGFLKALEETKKIFEETKKISDPEKLHQESLRCIQALRTFAGTYNDALRVDIADTLSFRVWSEQKRHSTLRQEVESAYSAAARAYEGVKDIFPTIEKSFLENDSEKIKNVLDIFEKHIEVDSRLKEQPELLIPYMYHTGRQLMFYGKLLENGFESRDALYIVPRNIRVRTTESYDLVNLIDLEVPLRLCSTCEPERNKTTWKKREAILDVVPEIEYFLQPKCNAGFCTEGKYCGRITGMREYSPELHAQVKKVMLGN
jgi:hypothetical protein